MLANHLFKNSFIFSFCISLILVSCGGPRPQRNLLPGPEVENNRTLDEGHEFSRFDQLLGNYDITWDGQVLSVLLEKDVAGRFCFFPTSVKNGKTVSIGNGQCLYLKSQTVQNFPLHVNRVGFGLASVRGVMIVLDNSYSGASAYHANPTASVAYVDCMEYFELHNDYSFCSQFEQKADSLHISL